MLEIVSDLTIEVDAGMKVGACIQWSKLWRPLQDFSDQEIHDYKCAYEEHASNTMGKLFVMVTRREIFSLDGCSAMSYRPSSNGLSRQGLDMQGIVKWLGEQFQSQDKSAVEVDSCSRVNQC